MLCLDLGIDHFLQDDGLLDLFEEEVAHGEVGVFGGVGESRRSYSSFLLESLLLLGLVGLVISLSKPASNINSTQRSPRCKQACQN